MKSIGTKDIKKGKKKGLAPSKRVVATPSNKQMRANQWQGTPQQNEFMSNWLDINSETFGNAHASALKAGYSAHYALQLSAPSVNNKWLTEYHRHVNLTHKHIRQGIQSLALKADDSRSPDDTRLKALELLSKIDGMIDNKSGNTTNVLIQPILGGKSVEVVSEQ